MPNHIKYTLTIPMITLGMLIATMLISTQSSATAQPKTSANSVTAANMTSPADTAIVLIGHGVPHNDFPRSELRKAMHALNQMSGHSHGESEHAEKDHKGTVEHDIPNKHLALKLINWPVTRENNPYYFGVKDIATDLRQQSGLNVFIGFNEFCGPTTQGAIETAIQQGYTKLIVTSVMLTPGGGHSEKDILNSMKQAQAQYPNVTMSYAWPFPTARIANVLHMQVKDELNK